MTWADDRGRLNHDVLANWIENELINIESDPGQNCPRLKQFLQREQEFRRLLDEAPIALSTAAVIDGPLFDVWAAEFRSEIRTYAHAVFLATSAVPERVGALYPLLDNCLEMAKRFVATNPKRRTTAQVRDMRMQIGRLRAGISALPEPLFPKQQEYC